MEDLKNVLERTMVYATNIISNYPERMTYHNSTFARNYVNNVKEICEHIECDETLTNLAQIGAWLIAASYEKINIKLTKGNIVTNAEELVISTANTFFSKNDVTEKHKAELIQAFREIFYPKVPGTKLAMILHDARALEFVNGDGVKVWKRMYKEFLLKDVAISKSKWYDMAINIINSVNLQLPYYKEKLKPELNELLLDIEKEKKKIEKNANLVLRKELEISDEELKQLKKNLSNSKGRDDRGIQTLFRTTSKNSYTMNEMVDRKANIMITVNSIILSLVLGGILGNANQQGQLNITSQNLPVVILAFTALLSIIFAVLSIRPAKTHGEFTEEEIRKKQGNLLFYGNFHNMRFRDYEWAFLQMMNDQDYLYRNMINDIYFLGQQLNSKYKHLRLSLTIFILGMAISFLMFLASASGII